MPSGTDKTRPTYFIGVMSVCMGLLCNEWVLKRLFSSDGVLEFETRVQIWFFDVALFLLGLFLIRCSRWASSASALRYWLKNYPRTTALILSFMLMLTLLVCAEGLFYFLNRLRSREAPVYEPQGALPPSKKFSQKDELLGYKPRPNAHLVSTMRLKGREIYNVTYSTDAYSRRVTPVRAVGQADKFILFFGCSFTFGEGVQNDETLPFFVSQFASRYRPYNYGMNGYGTQQMLAKLQEGGIKREIAEKQGILVYVFIDDHIHRVIGSQKIVQAWGKNMPYYVLDSNGNLERRGNFTTGRPALALWYRLLGKSEIATYFNFGFSYGVDEDDLKLTARIVEDSRNAFSKLFESDDFYVVLYPGSKIGKRLFPHFKRARVKYLDYSELFDPTREDLQIEGDAHPTPKAYRWLADQLTQDLGIQDIEAASDAEETRVRPVGIENSWQRLGNETEL